MTVVGLSADPPKKQKKFIDKYDFPYGLLSDESTDTLQAYQVWGRKKFMGREYDGIHRVAYLINEAGCIERTYPNVNTKTFASDVLEELEGA